MVALAENRVELCSFWDLIAKKVRRSPSVIQVARDNITRWLAQGQSSPQRLAEWDRLLADAQQSEAGLDTLEQTFSGEDEHSRRLRDFHPFAGILTREERRHTKELCGYRH